MMQLFRMVFRMGAALSFAAWPALAFAEDAGLAQAQQDFGTLCAPCHGKDAAGHGPMAASLSKPPADLTGIAARHGGKFPAEDVFETISGLSMPDAHGTRDMPVWGDVFVSEQMGSSVTLQDAFKASAGAAERIERLVRYVETLQRVPN
jgi:mono/diheme cytochrome c family protein